MESFPDFIIVGSAKSGTTALNMMLDQHPDVYMSVIKETNYFVHGYEPFKHYIEHNGKLSYGHQNESDTVDTLAKYSEQFKLAANGLLLGEASPQYLINSQVPQRIQEHNPNSKIVIILRNPSDVANANFVHQVRDRAESLEVEQIDRVFDTAHYAKDNLHPFSRHLDLPKYSKHLPPYLEMFDKDLVLIMIYEEFLSNRQASLNSLYSFLGLRTDVEVDLDKKVNVSGLPKSNLVQDLIQGSIAIKKVIGWIVPKKTRRKIRGYIEALNTGKKPMLDSSVRKRFDALYSEDVDYVEALLGREMTAWRNKRNA